MNKEKIILSVNRLNKLSLLRKLEKLKIGKKYIMNQLKYLNLAFLSLYYISLYILYFYENIYRLIACRYYLTRIRFALLIAATITPS